MNTTAKKIFKITVRLILAAAIILLAVVSCFFNEYLISVRESRKMQAELALAEAKARQEALELELKAQSEILIPQCNTINYYINKKKSDFSYQNPESNRCFLKVSITRLDTSETLYTSQLIAPGSKISNVEFFSGISHPGCYAAMVKVDAYALGKMSFLNSLVIETTIFAY